MSSPTPESKGSILIVDDELPIGELLQQWLLDEGYDTVYAPGFDRVQTVLSEREVDLVTLDIVMPDMDGLQVLRWIKEHYPDMGVIMATALDDLDTVLLAMRLGASGYLIKPFNMELVTEEIGVAMERQRLIAENRAYQRDLERKVAEQTQELRQAYDELSRRVRELEGRDRLVHLQMSGPGLSAVWGEVLFVFHHTFDVVTAVAYRIDTAGGLMEPMAALGLDKPGELADGEELMQVPSISLHDGDQDRGAADALCVAAHSDRVPRYGPSGEAAVPLVYQKDVLAILALAGVDPADREPLVRLASEAAVVLWSARIAEDLDSGRLGIDDLLGME